MQLGPVHVHVNVLQLWSVMKNVEPCMLYTVEDVHGYKGVHL